VSGGITLICCVCLNPTLDKVYDLDELKVGAVNRPRTILSMPAGKGINVARVACTLGSDVCVTGFLPSANGHILTRELGKLGIQHQFIGVSGELRSSLKFIDSSTKNVTEVIEPGVFIQEQHVWQFLDLIQKLAGKCDFVVLSGSLPQNLAPDFYARLIRIINDQGSRVVLDSSGEPFRGAVTALPYMIKPNIHELSEFMKEPLESLDEVIEAGMLLVRMGIKLVLISMGSNGALLCTDSCRWVIQPPKISAVNTVGCGDSLVAGFLANFSENDLESAVKSGVSAGAANAMSYKVGHVNLDDYLELLEQVQVRRL
jgi:1-phosphofructokinase family hexose kinase